MSSRTARAAGARCVRCAGQRLAESHDSARSLCADHHGHRGQPGRTRDQRRRGDHHAALGGGAVVSVDRRHNHYAGLRPASRHGRAHGGGAAARLRLHQAERRARVLRRMPGRLCEQAAGTRRLRALSAGTGTGPHGRELQVMRPRQVLAAGRIVPGACVWEEGQPGAHGPEQPCSAGYFSSAIQATNCSKCYPGFVSREQAPWPARARRANEQRLRRRQGGRLVRGVRARQVCGRERSQRVHSVSHRLRAIRHRQVGVSAGEQRGPARWPLRRVTARWSSASVWSTPCPSAPRAAARAPRASTWSPACCRSLWIASTLQVHFSRRLAARLTVARRQVSPKAPVRARPAPPAPSAPVDSPCWPRQAATSWATTRGSSRPMSARRACAATARSARQTRVPSAM